MKKVLLSAIFIIASALSYSQDIIYTISGDKIICKVTEILENSIKYKNFHQPDGPIRNIYKERVNKIKYEDESIEYFKSIQSKPKPEESKRDTYTDIRNGYEHPITKIGNQWWLGENLNYDSNQSWCYDMIESNCNALGRLYTWEAAMNVCPEGWHLPSDDEWKELEVELGMIYDVDKKGWRGNSPGQGKQLRVYKGIGFNARLAGYRYLGAFDKYKLSTYYWTSTENNSKNKTYVRELGNRSSIKRTSYNKDFAFSVRCVKGTPNISPQSIKNDKKEERFFKNNQNKYFSIGVGIGPGYGKKYGIRLQHKKSFGDQGYAIHYGGGVADKLTEYDGEEPKTSEGVYLSIGYKIYFYRWFYFDAIAHSPSYYGDIMDTHLFFESLFAFATNIGFETSISKDFDFCAAAGIMDIGNKKWDTVIEIGINWKIIK